MPPGPPLNPSPPKCPLVPRLNPKGLSNIWNRETSQHMPPCPPLNPSPPKCPLVPRLNPKGLRNIFKLLLFRGECDPFWFRGECDPLLGANVTPVPDPRPGLKVPPITCEEQRHIDEAPKRISQAAQASLQISGVYRIYRS